MNKLLVCILLCGLSLSGYSQLSQNNANGQGAIPGNSGQTPPDPEQIRLAQAREVAAKKAELDRIRKAFQESEQKGVLVRIKDISKFRGAYSNRISGIGLVTGLDGTGDSSKFTLTTDSFRNLVRTHHLDVSSASLQSKSIALVMVTATLPPFSAIGQQLDITVSVLGDAKSLRNGILLYTPLMDPKAQKVYAAAEGPITVGGFAFESGGNQQSKGFVTVGNIRGGGTVLNSVEMDTIFNGKMYIDLDDQDATTASNVETRIREAFPEYLAQADNNRTISLTIPKGHSATVVQSKIEELMVRSDVEARVVINERTGTIVIGGNVRIAACAFAKGNLSVRVVEDISVSQPAPFSQGTTQTVSNKALNANEDEAQVGLLVPKTTVADLAFLFREMNLKVSDIIDILQSLKTQGALKARIVIE